MGNSTIKLATVYNVIAAKGIPDPRGGPSGYGDQLALECASEVMADIVCERYNQKWNRAYAAPFYTNSFQQDYPQLAQKAGPIGWGEDGDVVDVNNTYLPKPMNNIKWRRGLSRTNVSRWWPENLCWMYNSELSYGEWPGADVVIYPLLGTSAPGGQNPILSYIDLNGNLLILDSFGTTGNAIPSALPVNSKEGTVVDDGTVSWICVSPTSQGFRIDRLPSAAGPTLEIKPYYQLDPPRFATMQQMLDPIPDSFSRFFFRGLQAQCLLNSPNPGDVKRGEALMERDQNGEPRWMKEPKKQGDRELNVYALLPATSVVEPKWGSGAPRTADNPYGWN